MLSEERNTALRVVEENVDGCGGDAIMYVVFSRAIDTEITDAFQAILRNVKNEHAEEDFDTEEMVNAAIKRFNSSDFAAECNMTVKTIDAPYFGVVTF